MAVTDTKPVVVIACDKFKGSLSAPEVVDAISHGVHDAFPAARVERVFVADGGDGTLDAVEAIGFERCSYTVEGPLGAPVSTSFALRGSEAVVEMADACGLVRVPHGKLSALRASSYGLGQVISAVLDIAEVTSVTIGVGGSASTDGGVGMLQALGARFLGADGREVPRGGGSLPDIHEADFSGLHPRAHDVSFTLASDVDNPLTGSHGAAAVFGPQKGASPSQVEALDKGLASLVQVVSREYPRATALATSPGAGAAGGVGFAAMAVLGARMEPGIRILLEMSDFSSRVQGADLVITGEGALDEQSLAGKTPIGVTNASRAHGVPVVAVCGKLDLTDQQLEENGFIAAYSLLGIEPNSDVCMREARHLLRRITAEAVAKHL